MISKKMQEALSWNLQWGLAGGFSLSIWLLPPESNSLAWACLVLWWVVNAVGVAVTERATRLSDEAAFIMGAAIVEKPRWLLMLRMVMNFAIAVPIWLAGHTIPALLWVAVGIVTTLVSKRCVDNYYAEFNKVRRHND